jgi:hypothetical protein
MTQLITPNTLKIKSLPHDCQNILSEAYQNAVQECASVRSGTHNHPTQVAWNVMRKYYYQHQRAYITNN